MYRYKIAAIAKAIFKGLKNIETEACRREWQFSLYYAISMALNNPVRELFWKANYSQWNIDHNFRAQEAALLEHHTGLLATILLIVERETGVFIQGNIEENGNNTPFEFTLTHDNFASLEIVREGRSVLLPNEIEMILESLLELEEVQEADDEAAAPPTRAGGKIRALTDLLGPIREIYANQEDIGKSYIETVIGASIFYLPHPVNECFSGYCSIDALNAKINEKSIVKEHITPRKYAAKEILDDGYDKENFLTDFSERFRRFMYLTASENRRTVNYAEESHDEALRNLGITKFPSGDSPFVDNHTYFMKFIGYCKQKLRANEVLTLDAAMRMLQRFSNDDQNFCAV